MFSSFPCFSNPTQRACFCLFSASCIFTNSRFKYQRFFSLDFTLPKVSTTKPSKRTKVPALHERDGTAAAAGACEAAAGGRTPGKAHLGVSAFICQVSVCGLDSLGHPSQPITESVISICSSSQLTRAPFLYRRATHSGVTARMPTLLTSVRINTEHKAEQSSVWQMCNADISPGPVVEG